MSSSFATFLFPLPLFFLLPSSCNLEFPLVHPLISLLHHRIPLPPSLPPTSSCSSSCCSSSVAVFPRLHLPSSASDINPIVVESNRYRPICFYCCFSLLLSHRFNRHSNLSGFTDAMNFNDFNTIGITAIPLLLIPCVANIQQAAIALTMTKASHVLSIFMFLEAKMNKFSCFLYHDHYLFAASPPSIHEFLEIQEMMNRRILSYRLPSSISPSI